MRENELRLQTFLIPPPILGTTKSDLYLWMCLDFTPFPQPLSWSAHCLFPLAQLQQCPLLLCFPPHLSFRNYSYHGQSHLGYIWYLGQRACHSRFQKNVMLFNVKNAHNIESEEVFLMSVCVCTCVCTQCTLMPTQTRVFPTSMTQDLKCQFASF